jgi:hypothetical protein
MGIEVFVSVGVTPVRNAPCPLIRRSDRLYRFLGATSSAKEHHMHIDLLQRIPEPIEQVIRQNSKIQNISEVASAEVRSAGGD